MSPKFGTSGLRGLVIDLTEDCVQAYTRAFLNACPVGTGVYLGRDLRPSSAEIAGFAQRAAVQAGYDVTDCGVLPTPALALAAQKAGASAIMITGSHIPADRNGLKFYTPTGEITKPDETAMLACLGQPGAKAAALGEGRNDQGSALSAYSERYLQAFGPNALKGLRIGVYQHSSVARDVMVQIVEALGGVPIALGHSDTFIPVDTEALDPATGTLLANWCKDHDLQAVISTDGDADRPMLADHTGQIIPGDVLGVITAQTLGAKAICTPISSNSMVQALPNFDTVALTRIGSPYVIAAMEEALSENPAAQVAGYEANGGFLLGFTAQCSAGPLAPLMTRDSMLPILAPLITAQAKGQRLPELISALPQRYTAANRLTSVEPARAQALLSQLRTDGQARVDLFGPANLGTETDHDLTDGLRIRFETGRVVHLRPSGNAPEFRCYVEAESPAQALQVLTVMMTQLGGALSD